MNGFSLHGVSRMLRRAVASPWFFVGVLGFLIIHALWIALTSLYPMAFDEEFHIGIIRVYSEYWLPFGVVQTTAMDSLSAVPADPSYLFHYLSSFPYRVLLALTGSETATIIVLRIMNIGLFVAALVMYRKVLLAARLSPALTHSVLAVFVLIPVVPLLAGQVNYDNLLLLVVAAALLAAIQIQTAIRTEQRIPLRPTIALVLLILAGAGIKYAFLPIALGIGIWLVFVLLRTAQPVALLAQLGRDFWRMTPTKKLLIIGAILPALVFGGHRYIMNIATYGDPIPKCDTVLNEERCMAYGPWRRDFKNAQNTEGMAVKNIVLYTAQDWSWGMWHRLYFTLAGPTNGYQTKKQLPIPSRTIIVISALGALLLLYYVRPLMHAYPAFGLFVVVTAIYTLVLLVQQYGYYADTARPVAINGRYLILLLPAMGAMLAAAYHLFFVRRKLTQFEPVFFGVLVLLFLQGGGALTYLVKSEPTWYWQQQTVQDVNQSLQDITKPFIIGD